MLVKCRKCNNKIDRALAFKVVVGDKNAYYCNEEEYKQHVEEQKLKEEKRRKYKEEQKLLKKEKERIKELKDSIYTYIRNIFGYLPTNTSIYKEMNEVFQNFDYDLVLRYLEQQNEYLKNVIHSKEFTSEYGKIRYFSAILKNSLADFKRESKKNKVEDNSELIKCCYDNEPLEVKYKRKKKKRTLEEIENNI